MTNVVKTVVSLWVVISLYFVTTVAMSYEMTREAIEARIKPFGKVQVIKVAEETETLPPQDEVAQPDQAISIPAAGSFDIGKDTYDQYCAVCHATGIAGAPKFQDQTDWQPRLEAGIEVMLQHVVQGYHAMPPKGTCLTCDPDQLRAAIEYMLPK